MAERGIGVLCTKHWKQKRFLELLCCSSAGRDTGRVPKDDSLGAKPAYCRGVPARLTGARGQMHEPVLLSFRWATASEPNRMPTQMLARKVDGPIRRKKA